METNLQKVVFLRPLAAVINDSVKYVAEIRWQNEPRRQDYAGATSRRQPTADAGGHHEPKPAVTEITAAKEEESSLNGGLLTRGKSASVEVPYSANAPALSGAVTKTVERSAFKAPEIPGEEISEASAMGSPFQISNDPTHCSGPTRRIFFSGRLRRSHAGKLATTRIPFIRPWVRSVINERKQAM